MNKKEITALVQKKVLSWYKEKGKNLDDLILEGVKLSSIDDFKDDIVPITEKGQTLVNDEIYKVLYNLLMKAYKMTDNPAVFKELYNYAEGQCSEGYYTSEFISFLTDASYLYHRILKAQKIELKKQRQKYVISPENDLRSNYWYGYRDGLV